LHIALIERWWPTSNRYSNEAQEDTSVRKRNRIVFLFIPNKNDFLKQISTSKQENECTVVVLYKTQQVDRSEQIASHSSKYDYTLTVLHFVYVYNQRVRYAALSI